MRSYSVDIVVKWQQKNDLGTTKSSSSIHVIHEWMEWMIYNEQKMSMLWGLQ